MILVGGATGSPWRFAQAYQFDAADFALASALSSFLAKTQQPGSSGMKAPVPPSPTSRQAFTCWFGLRRYRNLPGLLLWASPQLNVHRSRNTPTVGSCPPMSCLDHLHGLYGHLTLPSVPCKGPASRAAPRRGRDALAISVPMATHTQRLTSVSASPESLRLLSMGGSPFFVNETRSTGTPGRPGLPTQSTPQRFLFRSLISSRGR